MSSENKNFTQGSLVVWYSSSIMVLLSFFLLFDLSGWLLNSSGLLNLICLSGFLSLDSIFQDNWSLDFFSFLNRYQLY